MRGSGGCAASEHATTSSWTDPISARGSDAVILGKRSRIWSKHCTWQYRTPDPKRCNNRFR
eukprot:1936058-Prymnesium_polylepis.1